jgi:hypothetical protein
MRASNASSQLKRLLLVFATGAMIVQSSAYADDNDKDIGKIELRHEFRLLVGYSPISPTLIGTTTDRRLGMAELSYSYRFRSWNQVSLSYTAGILPGVLLAQPLQIEMSAWGFNKEIPSHLVYGFGVMPVGLFAEFAKRRCWHPIAEINGGVVASTEPIPVKGINATGLNFLFNFGGGIRWRVNRKSALTAGYRFLHISNANTTDFNPGLDNNVFYISYSLLH